MTKEALLNKDTGPTKHFSRKTFRGGEQLLCHDGKIYVPPALRRNVVTWYHDYLCHPSETRTEETIKQHLWWPSMRDTIRAFVNKCATCQRGKKKRLKYGHVPPKDAEFELWSHCLLYTSPSPRDLSTSRMPSSA